MRKTRLPLLAAVLLASLALAVSEEEAEQPSPAIEPVPGQLDVVEMTAVSLDGRLDEGVEPTGYAWKILEGEGGTLFQTDQQDAVFLAPKVERGVKQFVIELTVLYADQPPSVRQVRIRVLPTDPALALEEADPNDTQWLEDFYRGAREAEEQRKGGSQGSVTGSGASPSVSIGVRGGSGGTRGGIGIRVPLSYPITQPVDIPPPGQTSRPGEGRVGRAQPRAPGQAGHDVPSERRRALPARREAGARGDRSRKRLTGQNSEKQGRWNGRGLQRHEPGFVAGRRRRRHAHQSAGRRHGRGRAARWLRGRRRRWRAHHDAGRNGDRRKRRDRSDRHRHGRRRHPGRHGVRPGRAPGRRHGSGRLRSRLRRRDYRPARHGHRRRRRARRRRRPQWQWRDRRRGHGPERRLR